MIPAILIVLTIGIAFYAYRLGLLKGYNTAKDIYHVQKEIQDTMNKLNETISVIQEVREDIQKENSNESK